MERSKNRWPMVMMNNSGCVGGGGMMMWRCVVGMGGWRSRRCGDDGEQGGHRTVEWIARCCCCCCYCAAAVHGGGDHVGGDNGIDAAEIVDAFGSD